jgi:hypothetical protein
MEFSQASKKIMARVPVDKTRTIRPSISRKTPHWNAVTKSDLYLNPKLERTYQLIIERPGITSSEVSEHFTGSKRVSGTYHRILGKLSHSNLVNMEVDSTKLRFFSSEITDIKQHFTSTASRMEQLLELVFGGMPKNDLVRLLGVGYSTIKKAVNDYPDTFIETGYRNCVVMLLNDVLETPQELTE